MSNVCTKFIKYVQQRYHTLGIEGEDVGRNRGRQVELGQGDIRGNIIYYFSKVFLKEERQTLFIPFLFYAVEIQTRWLEPKQPRETMNWKSPMADGKATKKKSGFLKAVEQSFIPGLFTSGLS